MNIIFTVHSFVYRSLELQIYKYYKIKTVQNV